MQKDASERWISDDGGWIWEPATDHWLRRAPTSPPPSEVTIPPPPPSEIDAPVRPASSARAAEPPLSVRATAAPPPPEAGDPPGLSEIEFPEAAPTGELPPIANLVLDPPRADAGAQSGETRPGLAPGARPAVRSKARPAEPEEDRLAALLTPRALVVTAGVLAVIVAAVLFLARGGGGSERAARPASTQTAPSAASAAGFPAAAQRAYLDACVGNTPNRRPFCDCTLGQLQHSMTWPEFRQVGQQATAGDSPARQRYAATVVACANQLPRRGA